MNKGERTRQMIIRKAAPVLNQRGFAGCSMHDLMEATGLEKGGLYRHFASKEELAVQAFKYSIRQVFTARIGDLRSIHGAIPRLRYLVRAFVEIPSPIPGGCPLMNTAADIDAGSSLIAAQARTALRLWKTKLLRILKDGINSGELRSDLDPRKIANVLIATLEGALMISRLEGKRTALLDAQETLDTLLTSLTHAQPTASGATRRQIG